ncbi:hypothetical protein MUK42_02352 [Musa troglodytarum]|uniref:Uncharacterized protein n=1 Tax=Musa troglodytarum TaxID=320322 RepID=A0A9E7JIP4_9LILI|nr:hypothetical protein MUK42_02352 [Musa troglodytarum]
MREGGIIAEADGLERHRGIEHDDGNASELLEEGDEDGLGELKPILPLHHVAPRCPQPCPRTPRRRHRCHGSFGA